MKAGWVTKTLGQIAINLDSRRIPITKAVRASGEYPYYGASGIVDYVADYIFDGDTLLISEDGANLLARSTPIAFPASGKYWVNNHAHVLKFESMTTQQFVELYLESIPLDDYVTGAAQPKLNQKALNSIPIPLPPRPEQQRIVGILDEAFDSIATAKANAEKNLQNARALFESHLQSVFTRRGEEWDRLTLETLLERGWIESHLDGNHGGDYPRKEEFISEGVPYISANCLDDERVDMSRAKFLSPSRAALLRKGIAKDNDVLFAHNATVGPVAILRTEQEKVILGTSLTYYRCNTKHILPEYLTHYMRSFGFKRQYLQVMRQSTRNQVPITKQREFWHVIPPLQEQKRIVGSLDSLLENVQRLESLYESKLAALDDLKKSLLHQAFTGQL